jgi:hypothetical protein
MILARVHPHRGARAGRVGAGPLGPAAGRTPRPCWARSSTRFSPAQNVFLYARQFRTVVVLVRDAVFLSTLCCLPAMLPITLLFKADQSLSLSFNLRRWPGVAAAYPAASPRTTTASVGERTGAG